LANELIPLDLGWNSIPAALLGYTDLLYETQSSHEELGF